MVDEDQIVQAYIAVRSERDKITEKYEAEKAELDGVMDVLKANLLEVFNGINASSLKTQHGTVIKTLKERFYTNDWENFGKFIEDNKLVALLEKRIHQRNFKEYLEEHHEDGLPPGVNVMKEFEISVRKNPNRSIVE